MTAELWTQMFLVSGVLFGAAVIQGVAGFAFMVVAVTGLILAYPAQLVVPSLILAYLPLGAAQTFQVRQHVRLPLLGTLLLSSALGIPLGAWVLVHADTMAMKRGIGLVMVAVAAAMLIRPGRPIRRERWAVFCVGLFSGFLGASTSVSGPPVVLLGLKQRWEQVGFRATLFAYFCCISILAVPLHWQMGLVRRETVVFALSGFPGMWLGFLVAGRLRNRVSDLLFRRIGIGLVFCAGSAALVL